MTDISVEELKERLGKGETINILDVREQGEYDEFNLKGKLIPLGEIPSAIDDLEEWKNQEIVVHCKEAVGALLRKIISQKMVSHK